MKIKSTSIIIAFISASSFGLHTANAQTTWNLTGNSNATASSKLGTTKAIPLRLTTNNQTRVYINAAGNIGIGRGDSTSNYKLDVTGGAYGIFGTGNKYGVTGYSISNGEGVHGQSSSGYGVHGNSSFIGVFGEGGTYGLYGSATNYGVYGSSSNYAIYGHSDYMGVYGDGLSYGVYGYSPDGYGIDGNSDNLYGGRFISTNSYGIRASTTNGAYAGVFDGNVYTFGNYFTSSDKNLKKNIHDFGNALSIINKLKPKNYEFSTEDKFTSLNLPKGTHFGLIAQDVEEVLPGLVKESPMEISAKTDEVIKPVTNHGEALTPANEQKVTKAEPAKKEIMNIKGVNYEELIPNLIKGMQEQDAKIEALTQLVNQLQGSSSSTAAQNVSATSLSSASLDQNIPNPLRSNTSIHYTIPAGSSTAALVITDNIGNTVKQISLNSGGKCVVNIEASTLSAGTYSYTLIVDGKKIDTKKMVIAR